MLLSLAIGIDLLLADFEGADFSGWMVSGTAFGVGPARGTLESQMEVSGYEGKGFVNSYHGGDGAVGEMLSQEFVLAKPYIQFLIGGGKDLDRTVMQLEVGDQIVRKATGPNDRPGGSEALRSSGWDVKEYLGKTARIRIVDSATGGWGHICVDHIVQTERELPVMKTNVTRELTIGKRFMLVPIKNGAVKRKITVDFGDGLVSVFDVELADGEPDWWSAVDVSTRVGGRVRLTVDELPSDSKGLSGVYFASSVDAYQEAGRGHLHFSPRRGWTNDPNGLVFYNGEYHLFFQHNPFGWGWGNMTWGHAVSKDLVHWSEVAAAIFPDGSDGMFSGGAVVDVENVSGLGSRIHPALLIFYTRAGKEFTQNMAFSTDGRTFTKWKDNPLVKQVTDGNRDPKVIWHEASKKWVMAVYVEHAGIHTIEFYGSKNLLDWRKLGRTDGYFECPELYELTVEGTNERKWVLTAANGEYSVGEFDGFSFVPDSARQKGSFGRGYYAAQTFSSMPDGRRVEMGWFQTETRGMPFNQSMSVPMELSLIPRDRKLEVVRMPVREFGFEKLKEFRPVALGSFEFDVELPRMVKLRLSDVGESLRFQFGNKEFGWESSGWLTVGDERFEIGHMVGDMEFVFVLDTSGLEVFVNGRFVPVPVGVQGRGGRVWGSGQLESVEVGTVRSIWEKG